jgi:hypothetical protein
MKTLWKLVIALLCWTPLAAKAIPITYDVDLTLGLAGSVVGTITTDGTLGIPLGESNVIGWDLNLTTDTNASNRINIFNSWFDSSRTNDGLFASGDTLWLDPDELGNRILFFFNEERVQWRFDAGWSPTAGFSMLVGCTDLQWNRCGAGQETSRARTTHIEGPLQFGVVPAPSSLLLVLAGIIWIRKLRPDYRFAN